nr:reverse transcriptase domain-containing protein [Tanacetum cinerariifolium]
MCEMVGQLIQKKQKEKQIQEDQAANARYWKIHAYYDDDDDYNFAITPNETVDSLIMGDEHLDTILVTESDEFIKSSVENLVPNPSESEGKNGCDMLACFTTFSNILFDADYEFDSVDDQSLHNEDFPEEIFSNPLFDEEINSMRIGQYHFNAKSDLIESLLNHDSSIIPSSSKIDSLLDEFAGELTLHKSISSGTDETDYHPENEIRLSQRLLYDNSSPRPPKEFVSKNSNADVESFSPFPIRIEDSNSFMEEIDLTFTPDDPMPPSIEEDDDDSRGILIHEELLDNYSLPLLENKSFHFDIPLSSRPPAKPTNGNTGILNIKMMGDVSDQKVPIPKLTITLVSNQEKSPDLLSHRGFENFQPSAECPMKIHRKNIPTLDVLFSISIPLDQLKYGGIRRVVPKNYDSKEERFLIALLLLYSPFFGHDKEDPHAHVRYFNKITSTTRVPNIPSSSIKLMLFPFSLEGAARIWLEKEPPRSILTWDDLVFKFINQFFPLSKTTNLRNEIMRFQQRFDESFSEAWDRFNDLLRACPHHGFSKLHQLDTFYNALNVNDQDSLNFAAGGNFLDKMPSECLKIIESQSKVHQSRAKAVAAKLIDKKNQSSAPAPSLTPAPVKAVDPNCVTCGGA